MKYLIIVIGILVFAPSVVFANGNGAVDTVENLSVQVLNLINTTLIPLVFAIAFLVFIWGLYKYFILKGGEDDSRKEGKKLMVWGLIAFFVMVSVWGLVNIVVRTLKLDSNSVVLPTVPVYGKDGKDAPRLPDRTDDPKDSDSGGTRFDFGI